MTTGIDFKWKKVADHNYQAIHNINTRQTIILTAYKAVRGRFWYWSAILQHDHDDLQEYVEIRLVARTLAEAKEQAEIVVGTLIKTMKAMHEVSK